MMNSSININYLELIFLLLLLLLLLREFNCLIFQKKIANQLKWN
jgi:hypothetical protein